MINKEVYFSFPFRPGLLRNATDLFCLLTGQKFKNIPRNYAWKFCDQREQQMLRLFFIMHMFRFIFFFFSSLFILGYPAINRWLIRTMVKSNWLVHIYLIKVNNNFFMFSLNFLLNNKKLFNNLWLVPTWSTLRSLTLSSFIWVEL